MTALYRATRIAIDTFVLGGVESRAGAFKLKRQIRPYCPSDIDHYSRLFAPATEIITPDVLADLGCSTAGNATSVPRGSHTSPPVVALTYFGQFIDHDISFDATKLPEAGQRAPADTINESGGVLDLNQLYGDGPGSPAHWHLYEEDGVSFKLGEPTVNNEPFDIPLVPAGHAAAHPNNSENIILRQVHAMFLKLHNCAATELVGQGSPEAIFLAARERVRWQYQWLVRQHFLERMTTDFVYRSVTGSSEGWMIDWETDGFSIPVEFSQAAFRFGHSLVRHEYNLNRERLKVPLETIFSRDAVLRPLDPADALDWRMFTRETAMAIDTRVVRPLHGLSAEHIHHKFLLADDPPPLPPALPVRTLLRGGATRLPSGEIVAERFGRDPLVPLAYEAGAVNPWDKLAELELIGRTPLWFWILLEAETERHGERLGTVGSRIVAEVIEGSLWADPESYLRRWGRSWTPPPWKCREGYEHPIRTLKDVAIVTRLWPDRH